MYRSDVRHLHNEERNNLLFVQLGSSAYSSEPKYDGYKRGYGVFFRAFIATPQLQTIAVLSGIIGPIALFLVSFYFLLIRRNNA